MDKKNKGMSEKRLDAMSLSTLFEKRTARGREEAIREIAHNASLIPICYSIGSGLVSLSLMVSIEETMKLWFN